MPTVETVLDEMHVILMHQHRADSCKCMSIYYTWVDGAVSIQKKLSIVPHFLRLARSRYSHTKKSVNVAVLIKRSSYPWLKHTRESKTGVSEGADSPE